MISKISVSNMWFSLFVACSKTHIHHTWVYSGRILCVLTCTVHLIKQTVFKGFPFSFLFMFFHNQYAVFAKTRFRDVLFTGNMLNA